MLCSLFSLYLLKRFLDPQIKNHVKYTSCSALSLLSLLKTVIDACIKKDNKSIAWSAFSFFSL